MFYFFWAGSIGTGRCQVATCGRNSTCLLETVAEAEVKPGDVASTVMVPVALLVWTKAMQ